MPRRLASGIILAGHVCDFSPDVIGADAPDLEVARLANDLGAPLISKDADFLNLVRRGVLQVPFVRVRLGNLSSRVMCAIILPRIGEIIEAIEAGEQVVEVR